MRLFHVSEDPDISVFEPRLPRRDDLDKNTGLVWAVEESYLPLLLMPRDCPRVVYRAGKGTSQGDRDRYCLFAGCSFVVAVEEKWVARMHNTVLYLYEFDPAGFAIQDEVAGYYTARTPQISPLRSVKLRMRSRRCSNGMLKSGSWKICGIWRMRFSNQHWTGWWAACGLPSRGRRNK